ARYGNRMVYYTDTMNNKGLVMFGGTPDSISLLNDTWLFTGNPGTWSQCSATLCPAAQIAVMCCDGMTFDSLRPQVVMNGGQFLPQPKAYGDIWIWTAQAGWSCQTPPCNTVFG